MICAFVLSVSLVNFSVVATGALCLFICYCWWVVDCAGFLFDCGLGLSVGFAVVRFVAALDWWYVTCVLGGYLLSCGCL